MTKSQPSTNWRACSECIATRSMLHHRPSRLSQYSSTTALLTGSSLGRLVTHLHPRRWVAMGTRETEISMAVPLAQTLNSAPDAHSATPARIISRRCPEAHFSAIEDFLS